MRTFNSIRSIDTTIFIMWKVIQSDLVFFFFLFVLDLLGCCVAGRDGEEEFVCMR